MPKSDNLQVLTENQVLGSLVHSQGGLDEGACSTHGGDEKRIQEYGSKT